MLIVLFGVVLCHFIILAYAYTNSTTLSVDIAFELTHNATTVRCKGVRTPAVMTLLLVKVGNFALLHANVCIPIRAPQQILSLCQVLTLPNG